MPIGTRSGPRVELAVRCGGCKFLDTEKSYGSNDYEEIDYVCVYGGKKQWLPSSADSTPEWCPLPPPGLAGLRAEVLKLAETA
jgi:hypothetical protein